MDALDCIVHVAEQGIIAMDFQNIDDNKYKQLKTARHALREAIEHYDMQVEHHHEGLIDVLEVKRAYEQKEQCYNKEKTLFREQFPLADS